MQQPFMPQPLLQVRLLKGNDLPVAKKCCIWEMKYTKKQVGACKTALTRSNI